MTGRVYIVELEVCAKRFRTVAVRAENVEEAKQIAEDCVNYDYVQLGDDSESADVTAAAIVDPREPTAEELAEYADDFAELD
jgi:hypothetical protein